MDCEEHSRRIAEPAEALRGGVVFLEQKLKRDGYSELREAYRRAVERGDEAETKRLEVEMSAVVRQMAGSRRRKR